MGYKKRFMLHCIRLDFYAFRFTSMCVRYLLPFTVALAPSLVRSVLFLLFFIV